MNDQLYQLLGTLGFAIGGLGLYLLFKFWDTDKSKSISHHAAAGKQSYLLMAMTESISLAIFLVFTLHWMATKFSLPTIFNMCCVGIAVGFAMAAWIPVSGPRGRLHDFFAYTAALLFIPTLGVLASSPNITIVVRIVDALVLLILVGLFAYVKRSEQSRQSYLYWQLTYVLLFDFAILTTAYFG